MVRLVHVPPSLAQTADSFSHRLSSPVSSTSSASAKLDFPLPLRPTDHGKPGTGLQAQGRGLPDSPEAADRERPQVGTGRFWRGRGRPVTGRPRRSLAAELRRQAFFTFKCGEQQIGCLLL